MTCDENVTGDCTYILRWKRATIKYSILFQIAATSKEATSTLLGFTAKKDDIVRMI